MSRAVWKVSYLNPIFFSNFLYKHNILNIYWRNSCVPNLVSVTKYKIHNGIWYLSLNVRAQIIGLKFGEFSITKRLGHLIHDKRKKKSKR